MAAEKLLRSWLAAGAINDEHVAGLLVIHLDDLDRERMSQAALDELRPSLTPFYDSVMRELQIQHALDAVEKVDT